MDLPLCVVDAGLFRGLDLLDPPGNIDLGTSGVNGLIGLTLRVE
jgi:hypothetical protein